MGRALSGVSSKHAAGCVIIATKVTSRRSMKLVEALEALNESPRPESPVLEIHLACGFTPLHFLAFLNAHLRREFPKLKIGPHLIADHVSECQVDLLISNQATRHGFAFRRSDFLTASSNYLLATSRKFSAAIQAGGGEERLHITRGYSDGRIHL